MTSKPKTHHKEELAITTLQERVAAAKRQLDKLEQDRIRLDQQHEEAINQHKKTHSQETRAAFEGLNMTASEKQLAQFHELNKQKATPLPIDKIMASYEQAIQEAQSGGTPPPPLLPPRKEVSARYKQVQETEWEAALLALIVGVYKNNLDSDRPDDAIGVALELLPFVRKLASEQVGVLENLHQYFEGKRNELDEKIAEVENQQGMLESELYKLRLALALSMKSFFVSDQHQNRDKASGKAAEVPPDSPNSKPTV